MKLKKTSPEEEEEEEEERKKENERRNKSRLEREATKNYFILRRKADKLEVSKK